MHCEAGRIQATIDQLEGSWLDGDDTELLFVDDGSDDDTVEVVEKALVAADLQGRVLQLGRNQGKGAAVRAGLLAAEGEVVGFVDADLSTGIEDIRSVYAAVEDGRCAVAFASRAHAASEIPVHQPRFRQFSGKAFNTALRAIGLTSFRDTQCGLKAFRRDAAHAIFEDLTTPGFAFDVEVLARAERLGFDLQEVPVAWQHVEASSVSPTTDGIRMLRDAWRIRRNLRGLTPPPSSMAADAFEAMARVERTHWWFLAKRRLVAEALARHGAGHGRLLDVGSGTGALVEELGSRFDAAGGSELDPQALALARSAGTPLVRATAEHLPFRSASCDVTTCLDVVEHLDDDVAGLRELARVTGAGGLVVVAVPAYRWAWSPHDERLGHRRRYTRRQLSEAMEAAGLEVVQRTYFHSWLVPPALLLRKTPVRRLLSGAPEEASFVGPRVNALLTRVVAAERAALRRRDLPFGLSVFAVARVR
jgi:ubiquinone/menaquinone biosynthesis C-methylase UbiE